jgi:hypothetical protein
MTEPTMPVEPVVHLMESGQLGLPSHVVSAISYKELRAYAEQQDAEIARLKAENEALVAEQHIADGLLGDANRRVAELEAENKALLELSMNLDEHPDDYDGPCMCKSCQSYCDDDEGEALAGGKHE